TRWSRESRNLIRALRPEGRRGRPKTQKSAKPSKRALDPILAQRAYQMSLERKKWHEIARGLYPDLKPAERRTEKMRKRIERLIEKGGLDAKKLDGRNRS